MKSHRAVRITASAALLAALFIAASASAHISIDQGGTHKSRYGDGTDLKHSPCGVAGGTRSTNVYTYAPGETITLSIVETISHPSYFRIGFDNDGDDGFIDPASIKPIDPTRPCPIDPGDKCGSSDFYNDSAVLPGMDDLNPHLAGASGAKYTWQVTLPNIECDNCTLQVIQVMEDNLFHGDYNPNLSDPADATHIPDIYHQCVDLVLKGNGASGRDGGTVVSGSGGASAGAGGSTATGAGGGGPSTGAGGTTTSAGAGGTATGPENGGNAGNGADAGDGNGASGASGSSHDSGGCSIGVGTAQRKGSLLAGLGLGALLVARRRRRPVA